MKKIDLSKVKIGQQVKLRNNRVVLLNERDNSECFYNHSAGGNWYTRDGRLWRNLESREDIVKILPLPKKKVVKKPAKKMHAQEVRQELLDWIESAHKKDAIRTVISLLESLIK